MNLFLCQVCDYETQDKDTFNNHALSQEHIEKEKYYEVDEKIENKNNLKNEKRLDILLDMNYIKKKLREFNDSDNIRYLQKYHEYNYYKKHYNKSFRKMNNIVDGILLYKL